MQVSSVLDKKGIAWGRSVLQPLITHDLDE
jgi:hypothetical protein